jgi:hypothetical protein
VCIKISERTFSKLGTSDEEYCCPSCTEARSNKETISWANIDGKDKILAEVTEIHKELISWKKNSLFVPTGRAGKAFLAALNRILQIFINLTKYEPIALHLVKILIPLLCFKSHQPRQSPRTETISDISKRNLLGGKKAS